jgi:hypothetical protein
MVSKYDVLRPTCAHVFPNTTYMQQILAIEELADICALVL